MPVSTRKLSAAVAAASIMLVPLAACSSASDPASTGGSGQPILQIPEGPNGQYSAEQDREFKDATGKDRNEVGNDKPKALVSASTEECFNTPADIAAGTYVFEPDHSDHASVFYVSGRYQESPTFMAQTKEAVLIEVPAESTFCIERASVFDATADQLSSLSRATNID